MREYTSPGEVPVRPDENLTDALWALARDHPERPALAHRVGDEFVVWSTRQFVEQVRAAAKGLMALGLQPGERVALHAGTRIEWTVLDFAIWAAGGVTVPIYETSSQEQVGFILDDSATAIALVESAELMAVHEAIEVDLPGVREVLVIEDGALEHLRQRGAGVDDAALDERATQVDGGDVATIVYTSGTTGRPKGCALTHHNFVWDVTQVGEAERAFVYAGQRTLLFLPLAHIFARVIQVTCVRRGVLLGFATDVRHLLEELELFRPDFLLAVPRVFEKVYNGARQKAQANGKGRVFDLAADVAGRYSRETLAGRPTMRTRVLHAVFDRLVYAKIRQAMGGRVRHAVSGGAALGERLGHFFNGLGITVVEGYGLTETTAAACAVRPERLRIGTVGPPVPGASVRVDDTGEILLKGDLVFAGYHNDPVGTAEVLDADGWFRTGDLGDVDDEGFVRITGRKKELIVTATGKNVAPAVLEDRLRGHAVISQAMIVGDGRPYVAALLTLDEEGLARWAETRGKDERTAVGLLGDEDLQGELQAAVDDANRAVSRAESIRAFRILVAEFAVGDELSQKMSVKRHVVAEKYAAEIDAVYAEDPGGSDPSGA